MKLTFRDLKQQKFELDAEPTDLISAVKEKLHQEKGWEVSQQKLIYSGKILQDSNTVESYNITGGYIVCMVSKPKAAPVATSSKEPATPAPAAASTPAPPAAPAQTSSSSTPAAPATPSPAGAGASQPASGSLASAGSTIGAERAEAISNLESMGFARPEIEVAMRAAFYNADRAVEYLLNGIPENLRQQPVQAAAPAAASPPAQAAAGGDDPASVDLFQAAAAARGGSGGRGAAGAGAGAAAAAGLFGTNVPAGAAGGLGNLDFLRNNAQFQQLRQVVQQQPTMLEPILQQVAAGNPQLAAIISAHPEQFLQLLSEDAGDDDAPLPPGASSISVTEEERDAIERLCRLGFDREAAIQAYFACDKNEELAANFLFDQPEDDDNVN